MGKCNCKSVEGFMKKKKRVVWIWYIGKNVFQVSNRKIHIKLTDDDEIVKFVEA